MDWNAAKKEYITTEVTYRELSDRYGVSLSLIGKRASAEDWRGEREKYKNKSLKKQLAAASKNQVQRIERLRNITDKLLNKVEKELKGMQKINLDACKKLTAILKDIKDIQGIKCESDLREQEARIEKLQKDIDGRDTVSEISISVKGYDETWQE